MFTVVNEKNNLPSSANDNEHFFVSNENNIYVYSNGWISYENFVGGFELIDSVVSNNVVEAVNNTVLFTDVPYYENYKTDYYYPITFSATKIEVIDGDFCNVSLLNNFDVEHFAASYPTLNNLNFKYYYHTSPEGFESKPELLETNSHQQVFNVNVSNAIVTGPFELNIYKPIGV